MPGPPADPAPDAPEPPRPGALWTARTRRGYAVALVALAVAVLLAVRGEEPQAPTVVPGALPPPTVPAGAVAPPARVPAGAVGAVAVGPDAGSGGVPGAGERVVWGERRTGRVLAAPLPTAPTGARLAGVEVARVPVGPGGLRGLVVLPSGTIVVSRSRPGDGRLVVDRLDPDGRALLFRGSRPRSPDVDALGGALGATRGGRVVVGTGDVDDPGAAARAGSRAGRVLRIPSDRRTRRPEVLSRGWHDPRALLVTEGGAIWLADRARAGVPERIARAERSDRTRVPVRSLTAPTGLALLPSERTLLACGERTGRLQLYAKRGTLAEQPRLLPARCRYGVALRGSTVLIGAERGGVLARPLGEVLRGRLG